MMDYINYIILGIVQGISEWLPISSKTQIMILSNILLNLDPSFSYILGLSLEFGSFFAVLIYLKRDLLEIIKNKELTSFFLIATLFTALIGIPLYKLSKYFLTSYKINSEILMSILGIALIINGMYIYISKKFLIENKDKIPNIKDAFIVGSIQALSVLPGVSRSGVTITTMLFLGYKPETAFKYSYILGAIAMLGSFVLVLLDLLFTKEVYNINEKVNFYGIIISFSTSILISIITIDYILKFARKAKVYLINFILGIIIIIYSFVLLKYF